MRCPQPSNSRLANGWERAPPFASGPTCCSDDLCARADEVAVLGARLVREQRLLAPELAAPLYVRDKVAFTTAERLARGGKA